MENESWGDNSAFDIVSDILKMKANTHIQQFFAMNKATKEKVTHGSKIYDDIMIENNGVPDDIIISYATGNQEFISTFRLSEKKLPEIKPYEGNRKQRREAKREQKRKMKRK